MTDVDEIIVETNLSKWPSETKSKKLPRRVSRLPKCSKSTIVRPTTSDGANEQTLDFPTRMKLKEKISELQQLNNEMRFKLTTAETRLKAKDSELIVVESLNKQIKHLLDKHISREQELNGQLINLEKKITKFQQQISELEEDKQQSSDEKNEFQNLSSQNKELKKNLAVKEAQILDLGGQLADAKRSLSTITLNNKTLKRQLDEVKKIEPMLDARRNYINVLEGNIRHLEDLCSNTNEENCKLKYIIDRLEDFRFHSFLAIMGKDTTLLQGRY